MMNTGPNSVYHQQWIVLFIWIFSWELQK